MKAVMLLENKKLRLTEIALPMLAANACRVKIVNVGICSSDIQRSFAHGAYFYPLIMGHEMAGEIIATGSEVSRYVKGERVVVFPLLPCFDCEACQREVYQQCHQYSYYGSRKHGAYAEYLDVPEWNLLTIPREVSFADAAAIEPLAVVVHAIKRAGLLTQANPASVVIIGAGFLGLLMAKVLHLKAPHCQVTLIDRNEFKLALATSDVAQTVLLQNDEGWQTYLASKKNAYQVVVEATGIPRFFNYSLELASASAKIIWLGNITGDLLLSKKEVSAILRKELTLMGTWNSDYIPDKADDWKEALSLIMQGLKPSELVTQFISLDEVPETLKKLYAHKRGEQQFESVKVMISNEE